MQPFETGKCFRIKHCIIKQCDGNMPSLARACFCGFFLYITTPSISSSTKITRDKKTSIYVQRQYTVIKPAPFSGIRWKINHDDYSNGCCRCSPPIWYVNWVFFDEPAYHSANHHVPKPSYPAAGIFLCCVG